MRKAARPSGLLPSSPTGSNSIGQTLLGGGGGATARPPPHRSRGVADPVDIPLVSSPGMGEGGRPSTSSAASIASRLTAMGYSNISSPSPPARRGQVPAGPLGVSLRSGAADLPDPYTFFGASYLLSFVSFQSSPS